MFNNLYISSEERAPVIEPITLADVKAWMKVDYSDDDTLITALIRSARQSVEAFTRCSLVEKDITLHADMVGDEWAELPYGPVHCFELPEGMTVQGGDKVFQRAKLGTCGPVAICYRAGYEEVPEALRHAIMVEVDYRYKNRGSNEADFTHANRGGIGICQSAQALAQPYQRTWL